MPRLSLTETLMFTHCATGHSKFGQDVRLHCVHSFCHWLQFPSLHVRHHSTVVVLLSSDRVSHPTCH